MSVICCVDLFRKSLEEKFVSFDSVDLHKALFDLKIHSILFVLNQMLEIAI